MKVLVYVYSGAYNILRVVSQSWACLFWLWFESQRLQQAKIAEFFSVSLCFDWASQNRQKIVEFMEISPHHISSQYFYRLLLTYRYFLRFSTMIVLLNSYLMNFKTYVWERRLTVLEKLMNCTTLSLKLLWVSNKLNSK